MDNFQFALKLIFKVIVSPYQINLMLMNNIKVSKSIIDFLKI